LSTEIFRAEILPTITRKDPSASKDYCANIKRGPITFSEYGKPRESEIWDDEAPSIHRLRMNYI